MFPLREGPYLIDFRSFQQTQHSTSHIYRSLVNKCSFVKKKESQLRISLALFLSHGKDTDLRDSNCDS